MRSRPGEWLEYNPVAALFIAALGAVVLAHEFAVKGVLLLLWALGATLPYLPPLAPH